MTERPSRAELDRLGKRLLADSLAIEDVQALEAYRSLLRAHTKLAFEGVRRHALARGFPVTQRPDKSLPSIRRKLRDTTIRLGDMDDLVGCRITVEDRIAQDTMAEKLSALFTALRWKDRRVQPSSGYRALHGILRESGFPFEIQVRTVLQDAWANLSERLADHYKDISIKYGGGPAEIRSFLLTLSELVGEFEEFEELRQMQEVGRDNLDSDLTALPDVLDNRKAILQALADAESFFR